MINLEGYVRKHTTIKLGGKDFVFSELSISDFAQFQAKIVKEQEKTRDKRRERLIAEAEKIGGIDPLKILEQLDKPITDEDIEAEMDTVEGMGYLIYLSLKYSLPGITEEQVGEIVGISNLEEITAAIVPMPADKKKTDSEANEITWPTAIAMLCRFYNFSLTDVMSMTIRQFIGMIEQASEISKLESGEEKEVSLTGEQGAVLAKRMFPRGKL